MKLDIYIKSLSMIKDRQFSSALEILTHTLTILIFDAE